MKERASWVNPVEGFVVIITREAIRRDGFTRVTDLMWASRIVIDARNECCWRLSSTTSRERVLTKVMHR